MLTLHATVLERLVDWFGQLASSGGDWRVTFTDSLAESFAAIGKTGMAVAAILGITLDNLVPGTREERGLPEKPGILVPEAGDVERGPQAE